MISSQRLNPPNHFLIENLLANPSEGLIVYDRELRYCLWNRFMENLTGLRAEDVMGRHPSEVFPKSEKKGFGPLLKRALSGETVRSPEIFYASPRTGKRGWFKSHYYPQVNPQGDILGVITTIHEVTEQKKVEEALRDSEKRFQSVIETAGSAIICLSPRYEIFVFNREAERLFGYEAKEVLGQNYLTLFVTNEYREALAVDLQRVLEGTSVRDLENRITDRQGVKHTVNWNVDRLLDGQGGILGLIACGQDRTERKRAEHQLHTSHERFQMVMDSLDALVYVSDFNTNRLLFLNRHGERIWGKWEGKLCWEVLQARDWGPCEFCTNPLLIDQTGRAAGVHVWEFQNKVNGRWYECRDQAIHWTDGRLVRLEVATDITERRKAEQKAAEQNEFLKNVLESLTHPFCVIDAQSHQLIMANQAAGGDRLDGALKCHQLSHHSAEPCRSSDHPCPLEIIKQEKSPVILEHIHFDREGNRRNVDVHGYPIFDEEGRIFQIIEYSIDVTDRKKAEEALKEKEEYLRAIMTTVQTGVIISDSLTRTIFDANPYALHMIGLKKEEIIGQPVDAYFSLDESPFDPYRSKVLDCSGEAFRLYTKEKGPLHIRLSQAKTRIRGREYAILSFLDISDLMHLLDEQAVNVQAANQVLKVINNDPVRTTDLPEGRGLYIKGFSIPCHAAGGDHFFVRNLMQGVKERKTILSLKDQSGHEVNCILKSIITDLFHNAIIYNHPLMSLEESLTKLNRHIFKSTLFKADDFFTAVVAEIDHQSLMIRYASCGHPSFLLIRKDEIIALPEPDGPGGNLPIGVLPDAEFTAGTFQLQKGDKLLFYTDGLTEMPWARNKQKISFERLKTIIREVEKEKPDSPVSIIAERVLTAVSKISQEEVVPYFKNTSADDVSILAVEVEDQEDFEELVLEIKDNLGLNQAIRELKDRIVSFWKDRGLENPKNKIGPVLEEAVTNAWRHGNQENPDKKVTVKWRLRNDFNLEVLDQGEGFQFENIPDPTKKENRLLEKGRGIFMMRFFADEVRWEDGGKKVIISFHTQTSAQEPETIRRRNEFFPLWRQEYNFKESEYGSQYR